MLARRTGRGPGGGGLPTTLALGAMLTLGTMACAGQRGAGAGAGPDRPGDFAGMLRELDAEVWPDPDWRLRTLDGEEFRLGDFRGRPVFVNLWATWCPPCVAELASISRLAEQLPDSVVFLLVTHEDEGVVRDFLRRFTVSVAPVLEVTMAPEGLGATALPHTAIIGPEGRLRLSHRGATEWDTAEMVRWLKSLASGRHVR